MKRLIWLFRDGCEVLSPVRQGKGGQIEEFVHYCSRGKKEYYQAVIAGSCPTSATEAQECGSLSFCLGTKCDERARCV